MPSDALGDLRGDGEPAEIILTEGRNTDRIDGAQPGYTEQQYDTD